MLNVEFVLQNGTPNKKNPMHLEEFKSFSEKEKREIMDLAMFDDLLDYKFKKEMVTKGYNELLCKYLFSNNGKGFSCRMAMVAYDEYGDFPVWVAVADNRVGRNLRIDFYDPYQSSNRNEFSWAVRREENREE
ncbi:MAG: hypothetical protein [Bacteriophage sp.]|nr:MAG: hypothetical protein [Bacteriophage sp.]UVX84045.1 MAG: hypothetical protein [Bacteriophage sp.]UWI15976.1 MAG: hypothetical protein [Bacteriophage sp.]